CCAVLHYAHPHPLHPALWRLCPQPLVPPFIPLQQLLQDIPLSPSMNLIHPCPRPPAPTVTHNPRHNIPSPLNTPPPRNSSKHHPATSPVLPQGEKRRENERANEDRQSARPLPVVLRHSS